MNQNERYFGKYKQGQTIYQASLEFDDKGKEFALLVTFFLHSHKVNIPKTGELIVKMNESYVNFQDESWGRNLRPEITTSRRVAERKMKELQKEIDDGVYRWFN